MLNVGGGVHVKLRLRRPNRESDFFPFDQVLDTMLHELCHNTHGPHNANFYKLWDELRKYLALSIRGLRVGGVEIPDNKRLEFSLQYIHGIGHTTAHQILCDLNMENKITKDLSEHEKISLCDEVSKYLIECQLVHLQVDAFKLRCMNVIIRSNHHWTINYLGFIDLGFVFIWESVLACLLYWALKGQPQKDSKLVSYLNLLHEMLDLLLGRRAP